MYLFKELNRDVADPPPIGQDETNQFHNIESKKPDKLYEIDRTILPDLVYSLKTYKTLDLLNISSYAEIEEKLTPEGTKMFLEEYQKASALSVASTDINQITPSRTIELHWSILPLTNLMFSNTLSLNYNEERPINRLIISRYIRMLEILIANKSLLQDYQEDIFYLMQAIYLKFSFNFDYMDLTKEEAESRLFGLLKTFINILESNGLFVSTSLQYESFSKKDHRINAQFIQNSHHFCKTTKYYIKVWGGIYGYDFSWVASFIYSLTRNEYIVEQDSESGEYNYRLLIPNPTEIFNNLEVYDKRVDQPELPEHMFAYTFRDTKKVTIPILVGTSEFLTYCFMVPSTSQVMQYLRNAYGIEQPDPFMRYGKYTEFLTTPECGGFKDIIRQRTNTPRVDMVDIRTYLQNPPPEDKPSPFDEWFRFHTRMHSKKQIAEEIICGQ